MDSSIAKKLLDVQALLKVEKGQYNKFGGFSYRSKEDILEAAKPICLEKGLLLMCDDEVVNVADGWVYAKSTATVTDVETGKEASACGWAREPKEKKGMDASQITGTAASYAGKRALGNLFSIDDTSDADAGDDRQQGPFVAACRSCGTRYTFQDEQQLAASACPCGCREFVR